MLHLLSHNKIFYRLNICELSVLRNVTANDLKRAIFFSFTTLQYTKNALISCTKINIISEKRFYIIFFLQLFMNW